MEDSSRSYANWMLCFFGSLFLANSNDSNICARLHQARFMSAHRPSAALSGAAPGSVERASIRGGQATPYFHPRRQWSAGVPDACIRHDSPPAEAKFSFSWAGSFGRVAIVRARLCGLLGNLAQYPAARRATPLENAGGKSRQLSQHFGQSPGFSP